MKKKVLLLTGTVNSSGVHFMKRDDTEVRLNDYLNAISEWINKFPQIKIVFVENSNFPMKFLDKKLLNHKNFEYLTYNGQDFSRSKGKGFGEINSFEYAFNNSKFIETSDYIIKCNGRYFFKGFSKIINEDFDVIGNFNSKLDYMDSRVFAFKKTFFHECFLKYKNIINDSKGVFFEHALARAVHETLSNDGSWSPISFPLIIEGYSGTKNYRYNTSWNVFKIYAKFYFKKILKEIGQRN
ncbi:MAG: hypothetical protein ABJK28_11165 [Algibacter sp.]